MMWETASEKLIDKGHTIKLNCKVSKLQRIVFIN